MSVVNLLSLLTRAADLGPGKGILTKNTDGVGSSNLLTYKELLALAKLRSTQLVRRVGGEIENKVVLLNGVDHLENILWFWAIIIAGAVPCICPPLPKNGEQREERIAYLRALLDDPFVVTEDSLESEFDGVQGLRILSFGKWKISTP